MIRSLTSLRFIFALMVFASHLSFLKTSDDIFLKWLFTHILNEGYIGVTFFFILSGFILAYTYQESLLNGTKSKSTFFIARIARIYPLHILCLIISIPFSFHSFSGEHLSWFINLISNITLTQSFIPSMSVYFSFNLPSWSISDEMFFYLMFPFLIVIISKVMKNKFRIGILLSPLLFILFSMLLIPEKLQHQFFYINPVFRILDFIIGIFLFNIFKKIKAKNLKLNGTLLEFTSIFVLLLFFSCYSFIPQVLRFSIYFWIPMSMIVLTFSLQKGLISKILSNSSLFFLGEISFGFYLIHHLVIRYFSAINKHFIGIKNEYFIIMLMLIITVIASYFSFIWFETPMKNYIKNKWGNKKLLPIKVLVNRSQIPKNERSNLRK